MIIKQKLDAVLLVSALLLSGTAQAQRKPHLYNPFADFPPLRVVRDANAGVRASRIVWRRVYRQMPSPTNSDAQIESVKAESYLNHLSEQEIADRVRMMREILARDAKGWSQTEEIRLLSDGTTTRCETHTPDKSGFSVDTYGPEMAVFVEGVVQPAPIDFADVGTAESKRNSHIDSLEGMATLLTGIPLTTVLKDATFGFAGAGNKSGIVHVRRVLTDYSNPPGLRGIADGGDVRLQISLDTGRIERIETHRPPNGTVAVPGKDIVVTTLVVPSEYRTYRDNIQLPQKIAVSHYDETGTVLSNTEEYTLVSAQFNAQVDLTPLSQPFPRLCRVTDFRLGEPPVSYQSSDRPLPLNELRWQYLGDRVQQFVPYALLAQVPILAILYRRRRRQRNRRFLP